MMRFAITFVRDFAAAIAEGLDLAIGILWPVDAVDREAARVMAGDLGDWDDETITALIQAETDIAEARRANHGR